MPDFAPIFETHFFSNHHLQAQALETQLEALFPGCECVSFASFEGLLTTVAGEMCKAPAQLFNVSSRDAVRQTIESLNRFLSLTGRAQIRTPSSACQATLTGVAADALRTDAWLVQSQRVVARVLDVSGLHSMLGCGGVFISPDAALSEKIRWARSSYGRRGESGVRVFANGRLSEFQAIMLMDALDAAFPEAGSAS